MTAVSAGAHMQPTPVDACLATSFVLAAVGILQGSRESLAIYRSSPTSPQLWTAHPDGKAIGRKPLAQLAEEVRPTSTPHFLGDFRKNFAICLHTPRGERASNTTSLQSSICSRLQLQQQQLR
ncbi:hypothetical protein CERZMDRAFT_86398 [Cercospora zeae-maydis SCOH1-5]|uniref:Uncharacterized protein n=1 Tax=Cercospora zeae-maydis SCOH1-5 TaxID=717836 RepID=A0A6A6F9S5_9PEZI|nr:hypothetical protein CERZMDRAFT_86398 [Cercospora zeae-maydis SCOH1-5]